MVRNRGDRQLGRLPPLVYCRYLLDLGIRYDLCTSGLYNSLRPLVSLFLIPHFYAPLNTLLPGQTRRRARRDPFHCSTVRSALARNHLPLLHRYDWFTRLRRDEE
jgi:hypothetical protein